MSLRFLQDTSAASNQQPVVQTDFELLEYEVFSPVAPSKQAGVATTIIGPPTSGTWQVNDRWVDANGALFVCATAGTPGTWTQARPALASADPVSGTYPTNYRIYRTDLLRERFCLSGGTPGTWSDIAGPAAPIVAKTANYTITAAESGKRFSNRGAAGTVTLTLPAANSTQLHFFFEIGVSQTLIVKAGTGDTIRDGSVLSASAGNIQGGVKGLVLHLYCSAANEWLIDMLRGTWTGPT